MSTRFALVALALPRDVACDVGCTCQGAARKGARIALMLDTGPAQMMPSAQIIRVMMLERSRGTLRAPEGVVRARLVTLEAKPSNSMALRVCPPAVNVVVERGDPRPARGCPTIQRLKARSNQVADRKTVRRTAAPHSTCSRRPRQLRELSYRNTGCRNWLDRHSRPSLRASWPHSGRASGLRPVRPAGER